VRERRTGLCVGGDAHIVPALFLCAPRRTEVVTPYEGRMRNARPCEWPSPQEKQNSPSLK